ncbi:hypothetical protein EPN28_02295 [Patescibacteria group bacterium]|nr:MAG: hypothetical protein EPN28_02295 [Patescibacteria group bacterium]
MHISWLGQTCVKLQTKNLDEDVVILIDAYKPKRGEFPRNFGPAIAMFSSGAENAATVSQNAFTVDTLGEFEIKDCMLYSMPGGADNFVFKIGAEGLSVVHLGRLKKPLENGELEKILSPDILFVSVGGGPDYLEPKDAAAMITALEPRVIIPTGFKCDTDPDAKPLSAFISAIGLKPESAEKKVIIKKKDLPQEETKLCVLEKE